MTSKDCFLQNEFQNLQILIVEDNLEEKALLQKTLLATQLDIKEITHAKSCKEAASKLRQGDFDLALIDYCLPDGDGLTILGKIEFESPRTTPIVVTGNENERLAQSAIRKGAQDYIAKSELNPKLLERIVSYSLERHQLCQSLRASEQKLKILNSKLQEVSLAKSEFLSYLSHEIRTPLSLIAGATDLLLETKLDHFQAKHIRSFEKASNHILDVINNVLDINKIESGDFALDFVSTSLDELMSSISDIVAAACCLKGLSYSHTIDSNIKDRISTDPTALKQILLNIIGNAVKHTDNGGIDISVRLQKEDLEKQLQRIVFEIQDSGVGMSELESKMIFEKFVQGQDKKSLGKARSSGLGLHVARELAGCFNGHIFVKSELGKGTSFFVEIETRFLSTEQEAETSSQAKSSTSFFKLPNLKILFADDDIENRNLITQLLDGTPLDIHFAEDGLTALNLFQSMHFDLVFMDINMPQADGHWALKRMKEWEEKHGSKQTIIYALTGDVFSHDISKIRVSGFDGVVGKPLRKKNLHAALKSYEDYFDRGQFYYQIQSQASPTNSP